MWGFDGEPDARATNVLKSVTVWLFSAGMLIGQVPAKVVTKLGVSPAGMLDEVDIRVNGILFRF
jgi:hypothetical protein